MTTAYSLVKGALRLIAVIASGEEPTASDMADGIEALNQMAQALRDDGIGLSWVDIALSTEEIPVAASHIKALKYLLAVDLAPEYGVQPSPFVISQAEGGYRALQAAFTIVPDATFDTGLASIGRRVIPTGSTADDLNLDGDELEL